MLSIVTGGQQRLIALSLLDGSIAWQRGVTADAWGVDGDGQGHFLVDERSTGLHGFVVGNRTSTVWRSMTGHQLTASGRAFTSDGIHELITGARLSPWLEHDGMRWKRSGGEWRKAS